MPCYHPLQGWRSRSVNPSGKRPIVFDRSKGLVDLEVTVPCGQCIGCRLERSRQWAMRCLHEASLHEENCFLTLTYEDANLPKSGSLVKKDFQDFMKRLRKRYEPKKIRYYMCGEYGDENLRPHYHCCLFNHDFADKTIWTVRNGNSLYTSETLSKLWGHGYCVIGDVTFDSAAYVARYIMKKVTGPHAEFHYGDLVPEYNNMSQGIGKEWYEKFKDDCFPSDFIVVNGKKMGVPKYYEYLLDKDDPELLKLLKARRKYELSKVDEEELSARRLDVKQVCRQSKVNLLSRRFDND